VGQFFTIKDLTIVAANGILYVLNERNPSGD